MRITVYADYFVRPTETFIYETTKALAARGNAVTVIAKNRQGEPERPFHPLQTVSPPARWHPYSIFRRSLRPILGRPDGGERKAIFRERLMRVLAATRPDVVLANYGPAGVLLAPITDHLGVPLVTSFHGVDASRYLRDPEWRQRYQTLFSTATALTGPSVYVQNKLIAAGAPPGRTHVLHYGIPTDRIAFCPPGQRYEGGPIRMLFVGRLTPKKDPISLLRSYAIARAEMRELSSSLTLIGDGPMRDAVKAEISRLGLNESVDLKGHVSHDEVIAAYRSAHIYVQHSITAPDGDEEGLPVAITEALAGGLPVVSTRHSGIPEVVQNDVTGYVVDEGDVDAMGAAIAELARKPDRWDEMGSAGRRLLEREFAVDVVQARLQGLLRDAISSHRRAA